MGGHLHREILRPILADEPDACLGKHWQVVDRDVLGRSEHLDSARRAPDGGDRHCDLLTHLGEVRPYDVCAQVGDQLNHATAPCRPARAPSRR